MESEYDGASVQQSSSYDNCPSQTSEGVFDAKEKEIGNKLYLAKLEELSKRKEEIKGKKEDAEINESEAHEEYILGIINSLNKKLLESGLKKISPYIIQKVAFKEYRLICENILNEYGKVNWEFVKDGLDSEIQKVFNFREKRTFDSAVEDLRKKLEEKDPETFSPKYIEENFKKIYEFFKYNIRNEDGEIDWKRIVAELGPIGKRFESRYKIKGLKDALNLLQGVLFQSDVPISIRELEKINPALYDFFRCNEKNDLGIIDWEKIKNLIDPELREKLKLPREYFKKKYITQLDGFILNNGQSIITPTYLSKHCKGIFNKLAVCFRDANGDIDWRNIAAKLSSEAKDKFKFNRTKESALKELNYLLKEKNPNKINSRYIKQLDSNLFDFISKNFKNVSGYIDWPLIVNHLSNDLRLRFAYPVRYDRSLPDEQYEDGAEVEKMLNENNKYLYTFFQASGTEDLEKRNEICLSLIELAKKGNKAAETKLIDLTYFLVDKWAETIPSFRVLKFHKETCYEIIRRCIYNYKIKGPFIGYVFASLKKAALGLEQMNEFSHNEHIDYKKSSFVE